MTHSRRNFIRTASLSTLVGVAGFESVFAGTKGTKMKHSGSGLKLSFFAS